MIRMEARRALTLGFHAKGVFMGPDPGVLLLTSVDVPNGAPAERLLKTNCNVFGVSQEAAFLLSITEILNRQLGYGLS